jgi:hypothetical protein
VQTAHIDFHMQIGCGLGFFTFIGGMWGVAKVSDSIPMLKAWRWPICVLFLIISFVLSVLYVTMIVKRKKAR